MRIPLPIPVKSYDDNWYWLVIEIYFDSTRELSLEFKNVPSKRWVKDRITDTAKKEQLRAFEKRAKGGLRTCPGHRRPANYSPEGHCGICKGWKRQ